MKSTSGNECARIRASNSSSDAESSETAGLDGLPFVDLYHFQISSEVWSMLPQSVILKYQILPLKKFNNELLIAIAHPQSKLLVFWLRTMANVSKIKMAFASPKIIQKKINDYYVSQQEAA